MTTCTDCPRTATDVNAIFALVEYGKEMEQAIPQIINDVRRREALASDARQRIMQPGN